MDMTTMYTQKTFEINGHHAWLYLIPSPIGNIFVVEHENRNMIIEPPCLYWEDLEAAEKKFRAVCRKMVKEFSCYVAALLEKKAEELETTVAEIVEELIVFLDDCE